MLFSRSLSRPLGLLFLTQAAFLPFAACQCGQPTTVITNVVVNPSTISPGQLVYLTWSYDSSPCVAYNGTQFTFESIDFTLTCNGTDLNVVDVSPKQLSAGFVAPGESNLNCTQLNARLISGAQSIVLDSVSIKTTSSSTDSEGWPSIAMIAGIAGGGVIILAFLIAFVYVTIQRCRKGRRRVDSVMDNKGYSDDLEKDMPPSSPPLEDHYYVNSNSQMRRERSIRYPRPSSVDIVTYATGHVDDSPPNSKGATSGLYRLAPARESTPSIIAYGGEPVGTDHDPKYRVDSFPKLYGRR